MKKISNSLIHLGLTLALTLVASMANASHADSKIHCIVGPRLFVGNIHLNIDQQNSTFEIGYDNPTHPNQMIISAQGKAILEGKDSMGFDKIYLCTGEPCGGQTLLGHLKAVDRINDPLGEKVSYLRLNPNSNVEIKINRFGVEGTLTGLHELSCRYTN